MPRPRTLGAITVTHALARVRKVLRRDPTTDPAINLWGVARGNMAEGKLWGHFLPKDEQGQVRLRRFGRLDPATGVPPPPKKKRGRPAEVGMDTANAFLLKHYPKLAEHPLEFAMLEALFLMDLTEAGTTRFPPPARWDENRSAATGQLRAVERRARARIARALALLRKPRRAKKTAPRPARR